MFKKAEKRFKITIVVISKSIKCSYLCTIKRKTSTFKSWNIVLFNVTYEVKTIKNSTCKKRHFYRQLQKYFSTYKNITNKTLNWLKNLCLYCLGGLPEVFLRQLFFVIRVFFTYFPNSTARLRAAIVPSIISWCKVLILKELRAASVVPPLEETLFIQSAQDKSVRQPFNFKNRKSSNWIPKIQSRTLAT